MLLFSHFLLLIGSSGLVSISSMILARYGINSDISIFVSSLVIMSIVTYIIASTEKGILRNEILSLVVPLVPLIEKGLDQKIQEEKKKNAPKKTLTEEHKQKIREATAKRKRVNGKFV